MRIRDGSSDVCSSDLAFTIVVRVFAVARMRHDDQTIALEPPADAAAQASAAFVEIERVLQRRPDVDLMELRCVEVAAVKDDAIVIAEDIVFLVPLGGGTERFSGSVIIDRSEEHPSELQSLMRNS